MNTNGIYSPNVHMATAHRQTVNTGLSRIEITYTAKNQEGLRHLLAESFQNVAGDNLDKAQNALNKVKGLGW